MHSCRLETGAVAERNVEPVGFGVGEVLQRLLGGEERCGEPAVDGLDAADIAELEASVGAYERIVRTLLNA